MILPDVVTVHEKVVPVTVELSVIPVLEPEQIVCGLGFAETLGMGLTIIE